MLETGASVPHSLAGCSCCVGWVHASNTCLVLLVGSRADACITGSVGSSVVVPIAV